MSERQSHLIGWGVFLLSALLYLGSSWRSGDTLGVAGSVLFFLGCLFFLVPLLRQGR